MHLQATANDIGTRIDTGTPVSVKGLDTRVLVPSNALGSAALLEHRLEPATLGAPLHRHQREDEILHVLEGELTVRRGDTVERCGPGDTAVLPRNLDHTFWNDGETAVRFLATLAPGTGLERFYWELAPLLPDGGPHDLPGVAALAERYGIAFDLSTMPALMQRYGLRR
jgi:mannose-6-phosphate isomerase-like protein (cupin superfamily)